MIQRVRFIIHLINIPGYLSVEYEYNAEYLSRLNYFEIESGDQVGKMEFSFNNHGNLVSMTDNYTRDYELKEEYFYEEGTGNYEQLILPGPGISSEKNLPHPK